MKKELPGPLYYLIREQVLAKPTSHAMGKIEQLSESGGPPAIRPERRPARLGSGGQLSRVGFVAVVVVCSLIVLVALLLFAHAFVRRRDRLNGYLPGGVVNGRGSRKPSEKPLVPAGFPSPSGSILNTSALDSRNDSLVKKSHQGSTSSYSTGSPPLYQETPEQVEKQVDTMNSKTQS
ncbi:hypothetical protein Aperf_G00000068026 [Anoplocephala perfoliata]